jgi:hypothetical protein
MLIIILNIFMMLNAFSEAFYAAKMAIIHKKREILTIFD